MKGILMNNVWNIRKNKNLNFILSEKTTDISGIDHENVAIIAYIYYEDTVQQYLKYLKNISDKMAIYLISSNENTLKRLNKFAQNKKNVRVIEKNNRGRDISALVISSREIFFRYSYVCFVHDKRAKLESNQEMVSFWIKNLWGNTLNSGGYIENILKLFTDYPNIGLLVPPEPYIFMRQSDFWSIEYERTIELAKELNLTNTTIERKYPPITLGTVFWCRTYIMKKLFDKEWRYEDFVEEPMPEEGTISHAVERIFAYLAQDAGSETATVMSESYAKELIMLLQREKDEIYRMLNNGIGKNVPFYLWEFYLRKEQIKMYVNAHDQIYLFGDGEVGKCYFSALKEIVGCNPEAFLVSDSKVHRESITDIAILPFEAIHVKPSTGIIISVGRKTEDEIKTYLQSRNYNRYLCVNDLLEDTCL